MKLEILTTAIQNQLPISFTYNKKDKDPGIRIGNPHAVFIMKRKDGHESTRVHIVQTEGVSDSGEAFPSFRLFDLSEIDEIVLLSDRKRFDISPQYNPDWPGYTFTICRI